LDVFRCIEGSEDTAADEVGDVIVSSHDDGNDLEPAVAESHDETVSSQGDRSELEPVVLEAERSLLESEKFIGIEAVESTEEQVEPDDGKSADCNSLFIDIRIRG